MRNKPTCESINQSNPDADYLHHTVALHEQSEGYTERGYSQLGVKCGEPWQAELVSHLQYSQHESDIASAILKMLTKNWKRQGT